MKKIYRNFIELLYSGRFIPYKGIMPTFKKDYYVSLTYKIKDDGDVKERICIHSYIPYNGIYAESSAVNIIIMFNFDEFFNKHLNDELFSLSSSPNVSDIRYTYIKIK